MVLIYTFLCLHYQTTWWAKKLWLNTTHKLYVLTSQTVNPVLLHWWISQIAAIIRNHVTIWTCSKRDFTLVVSFGSNNVKPLHFLLVFCVLSALISVFISVWYILYRTQVNRICFVQILTQACPIYFETTKQTQAHTQKKNPSQTFITASMDTVDWVTGKKLDHWFVTYRGEAQKRFKNSTEGCLVLLM